MFLRKFHVGTQTPLLKDLAHLFIDLAEKARLRELHIMSFTRNGKAYLVLHYVRGTVEEAKYTDEANHSNN